MSSSHPIRYRFDGIVFDPERGLEIAGALIPMASQERRLLGVLLEADGRVVSKNSLVDAVWRGAPVSDASIARSVYRLRRALRTAGVPKAVATMYGGGFRMAVAVRPDASAGVPGVASFVPLAAARECVTTARELVGRRGLRDMIGASLAVRRAVRLDPAYAEAWVLLAQIAVLRVNRGQIARPSIGIRRARWAIRHALAAVPDFPGALAMKGWITAVVEGDCAAGLALLDRALDADHDDWTTHMLKAWALHAARRPEEGLASFAAMTACNPLSTFALGSYGYALACSGRITEAMEALSQGLRVMPTVDSLLSARSSVAAMAGDLDLALSDARRCAELAPDVPNQLYALAYALGTTGAIDEARTVLVRMLASRSRLAPSWHAIALIGLRERDAAAQALQRAQRERCPWYSFVQYDPRLRGMAAAATAVDEGRVKAWT